jgi:ABC-type transport system involved in multi-copper enzyme maturation permease subunit
MKALAILKDSLREAKDSKVLLVMLILSGIFLILLASIGYKPVPVDQVLQNVNRELSVVTFNKGQDGIRYMRHVSYTVEKIQTLKESSNPATGKYSFILRVAPLDTVNGTTGILPQPTSGDEAKKEPKKEEKKPLPTSDAFTESVKIWNSTIGDAAKMFPGMPPLGPGAPLPPLTFEVTGKSMEDFIREQLAFHYNINASECVRKEAPLVGPQEFQITIEGSDARAWPHDVSLFFNSWSPSFLKQHPLGTVVWYIEDQIINGFGAGIAILVGIFITAFFIPEMLRKGAIDLLLSKPLQRGYLLFWKYMGGLLFMLILAVVNVGGVWLILGIRSGIWNPNFLLAIPMLVFSFAVLYAMSTLVAMLTRSAVIAIVVTCFFALVLYIVGKAYTFYDTMNKLPGAKEEIPGWVHTTATIVHGGLPRTNDIDKITTKLIAESMTQADQQRTMLHLVSYPPWATTLGVSLAWIAGLLGLAWWRFSTRDY